LAVLKEHFGSKKVETQSTYNWIVEDLKNNPLLPGQTIVLVGHSGGGEIVSNLPGMIEDKGYDVSGVVTLGSPVVNFANANDYAETILDIRHGQDYIGARWIDGYLVKSMKKTNIEKVSIGPDSWLEKLKIEKSGEAHKGYMTSEDVLKILNKKLDLKLENL